MRDKRKAAKQRLAGALARAAPVRAADLARDLDISVPTLHRLFQESTEPVLTAGRARRTRYALRRPLRGDLTPIPIHAIDEAGQPYDERISPPFRVIAEDNAAELGRRAQLVAS